MCANSVVPRAPRRIEGDINSLVDTDSKFEAYGAEGSGLRLLASSWGM